jgi:hypothetical protein
MIADRSDGPRRGTGYLNTLFLFALFSSTIIFSSI